MSEKPPKFEQSLYKNPETGAFETKEEQKDRETEGSHREEEMQKPEDAPAAQEASGSQAKSSSLEEDTGLKDPSRRRFLAFTGEALTGAVVLSTAYPLWQRLLKEEQGGPPESPEADVEAQEQAVSFEEAAHKMHKDAFQFESEESFFNLQEQIERYGKIKDLYAATIATYRNEYAHLMVDPEGQTNLKETAENVFQLDLKEMARKYNDEELAEELFYVIPLQETNGDPTKVSPSGAVSLYQIMPRTAEWLGYDPEALQRDPTLAAEASAKYVANERDNRFGNDPSMLLYSYNAGGGLFGFTESVPKKERTPENFYAYMTEQMNAICEQIVEEGVYEYTIEAGDTLTKIGEKFGVSVEELKEVNDMQEDHIEVGAELRIPFNDLLQATSILFRKPYETLEYTPKAFAKYMAFEKRGYNKEIAARIRDESTQVASAQ